MGRRGRRSQTRLNEARREETAEREALERRWHKLLAPRPELGKLVTGQMLSEEPFHRWLPYQQAFSPELVRIFLREADPQAVSTEHPLLDPFAGVGTFVVECVRNNIAAVGLEALEPLTFVARCKGCQGFPRLPELPNAEDWELAAPRLMESIHRAALICAVATRHTAAGRANRGAPPLLDAFDAVVARIREDLRDPLPTSVDVRVGDARNLSDFGPGSIAGVLTSPPYLSRHDYERKSRPHDSVYRTWYPSQSLAEVHDMQVRAHSRAPARPWDMKPLPAVAEAVVALRTAGESKLAGIVRSYFEDLAVVLHELFRVLRPGAPFWLNVGGARLKGVYVPADLILAELAREVGFEVQTILVARRLIAAGRKLGTLTDVAPREVILVLRR